MRRTRDFCLFAVLAIVLVSSCSDSEAPALDSRLDLVGGEGTLALINGRLIDGTGADPVSGAAVIVRDGRIEQIGVSDSIRIDPASTIIDLDGATILPGFINSHVHRGYDESRLQAWASAGVTTVRDLGANPSQPLFADRDALLTDNRNARLVCAGPLVTVPGGYPMVPWGAPTGLPVDSVDEARREIEELLDRGADIIKVAIERGDIFGRSIPTLPVDVAMEICRVAHTRGTLVSAHVTATRDLELALAAGVDDIAHMVVTPVADELIDRLVSAGVAWIPTLELWHGVGYGFPAIAEDNLRRFVEAGGEVALGTDYAGYSSHFDLGMPLREIGWMRDAGMTPMEVIVAATRNAARLCNLGDELGTIEAGRIADILVVNGDPLDQMPAALADVRLVIHNGEVIVDRTD